jgi:hypothetical protein
MDMKNLPSGQDRRPEFFILMIDADCLIRSMPLNHLPVLLLLGARGCETL